MGNKLLSQCHNQNNNFDDTIGLSNTQKYKGQKTQKQLQISQKDQFKNSTNQRQFNIQTFTAQKPEQIVKIYQKLLKQKAIAYSIQRQDYLSNYSVSNLKQLSSKIFEQNKTLNHRKTDNKLHFYMNSNNLNTNRIHKTTYYQNNQYIPESSTFSQRSYSEDNQHINISIIEFYLGFDRNSTTSSFLSQNDKNFYRARSLSKEIQDYNYQDKLEQDQVYQSIMDIQKINIYNKKYIYIGFLNEEGQPHGPGQLYHYRFFDKNRSQNNKEFNKVQNNLRDKNQVNPQAKSQILDKQNLLIFIQANFVNGSIQTQDCVIIFKQGHYFRGGFYNQNFNSKGKLYINPHLELIGNFTNGLLNGKGKSTYVDGGSYQGNFVNGLRQGKGKMIWKSQSKQKSNLQIIYDGYFKDDKMNGLGHLKTPNYQYWGPFVNNTKQGKGTIKFKDGNKFEGWFQKDQIKGYGELHYADGRVQKGIFPLSK